MPAPVFIGDELSAAGFRLAGVRIRTPEPDHLLSTLNWASANASFIMITQAYFSALNREVCERYLQSLSPPLIVLPDILQKTTKEDLAFRMRSQIGVLE